VLLVCLAVVLSACQQTKQAKAFPNWPYDEEGRRIVPDADLLPYDVALPEQMNIDLGKTIWFALTSGSAASLNSDFQSCTVLLDPTVFESKYDLDSFQGTLSGFINGTMEDYAGLLCQKNIIIWKGKEPFIKNPVPISKETERFWRKYATILPPPKHLPNGETRWECEGRVFPLCLDRVGASFIDFYPSDKHEITLPDGRGINVIVEHPDIYETYHTPDEMVVDLPEWPHIYRR